MIQLLSSPKLNHYKFFMQLIAEELNVRNVYTITRGWKINYNLDRDELTATRA